jgi:hypothetical protein
MNGRRKLFHETTAEFTVLLRLARQLKKMRALVEAMDEGNRGRKETYECITPCDQR